MNDINAKIISDLCKQNANILVVSECGAGKTTVLRDILDTTTKHIDSHKITLIQWCEEIKNHLVKSIITGPHENLVRTVKNILEGENPPDRLFIGELMGSEIRSLLENNTCWAATLHGRSPENGLLKLEKCASLEDCQASKEKIASNVDYIVMVQKRANF